MQLTDEDLYNSHYTIKSMKKETYDKLYNQCITKIKLVSKKGLLYCTFKIPKLTFSSYYPKVSIPHATEYISLKLVESNENIKVTFLEPDVLFIQWEMIQ